MSGQLSMESTVLRLNVYPLLGKLLYACQRIEWTMKYMVEQACRKVEFKSGAELEQATKLEPKWPQNNDTLGKLIKEYMKKFYGEQKDDFSDSNSFKLQIKISFNADEKEEDRKANREKRDEEFDELLSIRNFLAHQFGLRYHLLDEANCNEAIEYLRNTRTTLQKHLEKIDSEYRRLQNMLQQGYAAIASSELPAILESVDRLEALKGKIGKLKSYDFSKMASRTIFDYTDNQDFIDAILLGVKDVTPEIYESLPLEGKLAHLQCLADLSGNQNFIQAVNKQRQKLGTSST